MDLLKQCQQWFEQDEAQKVIDTLEAIPAEERTPELDSELAKAYIAVAHIGEREPFEKALELLAPHEEHFAEDHCWNYRIASAYYFLDEEGPALRYFEKALKARPGDKDTQEYIDDCRRRLSLPRFEKNFRERTQEGWAAFSQIEAELRQIIDTDETHQRGEELVEKCGNALKTALRDTSFELGFNGEKYELILSPEGLRSRLFPLVYFQKQAPESVLEHWNIWVGRQPCEGFELRAGEIEVRADDVQMWAEETEDHQVSLVLYCEKLTPILKEDTDKVWWALSMLVDQTIGEVSAIAFVAGFDVYPWIWLHLGKLRAHFGDKSGALDAVKQGLKLEPGDYEFLTLKKEIKAGATLEQMEYHWINPDADQTLQRGLDENADDKQCAIACIRVDEAGLAEFYELFHPERYSYKKNSPCCEFQYPVKEHLVELSFRMNEAGLSKMGTDWLRQLKERLDSGEWLTHTPEGEPEGILTGVFVDQLRRIGLVYQQPGDDQYFQIFLNPDGTKADAFWSSRKNSEPEVYSEDEMSAIEQHIKNTFGEFENVFHELVSPDIHVDICVVPPSEARDYYTLVTMGMGAHRMNVPEELAEYKLERAELAIALPKDWKLDEESLKDERWYWPIGLLKVLARLPISNDTWLGFGHTMDKQSPFAEDTELCAALLVGPQDVVWNGGEVCTLPSGEEVNFYQVIPLYRNEMEYKMEHDADALLKKMAGISFVVNPTRQNAITRGTLAEEEFTGDMDDAAWHLESIQEKGLPVNEINAYNHMAIYLRWCIEHDLMSAEFMERYWEQVQPFMADLSRADLRGFIRDQLKGQLFGALFNKEGAAFAGYYYGEADSPYFPSDIDNYALEYFGSEQYYSDKFQDEAYLFIPFDENYYQAMAKVMEKRFANWQGQSFDEATLEPSDLAEAMMEYLDCECTYFPSMTDDDPIMSAYNYAKRESVKEGFVPVLIKADDEILWECLIMNSDPDSDGEDDFAFDPDKVAEYRKKMLSAPVENSKAVLEEMIGQRKEEAEDDDMDWDEEILGEMEGGYDNRRFSSYWNSDNNMTYPLILAKIPVKNPWEIFAYLPFGGWNECPNTPELMAVAKYWFEQHGAVPAAMSHDELEFLLPAPVPEEKAMDAAVELYGFCPDVIDQGPEDATVGALADVLRQSTVWYFWWD